MDIPTIDNISRRYNTKKLYKLGKEDRISELKNAFIIKDNTINLKNKNVLLVDDIFTTGSTVNEISKVLKLNGVNKVFVATFLTRADTFYVKG
jgi:competence protein ComFC